MAMFIVVILFLLVAILVHVDASSNQRAVSIDAEVMGISIDRFTDGNNVCYVTHYPFEFGKGIAISCLKK